MKEVRLVNSSRVALVDDSDYDVVSRYRWFYVKHEQGISGYASSLDYPGFIFMHQLLMGPQPKGMDIDHKNRDGLDNTRKNLRVIPHWLNGVNVIRRKNNKSGYKGVYRQNRLNLWSSEIKVGMKIHLGSFNNKEEAHKIREDAESIVWSMWEQGKSKEEIQEELKRKYYVKLSGRLSRKNRSGFTGVSFIKRRNKWLSYVGSGKSRIRLGTYNTLEDAHKAREDFILNQQGRSVIQAEPVSVKNRNTLYRGVSLHKTSGKYRSRISIRGVEHYLGLFNTPEEAARAREEYLARSKESESTP